MIDAFDYDKIAEFRRLWETHGSRQDFRTAEFFDGYVDDGSFMIQGMTVKQLQYCFKRLWLLERWHEIDWTQYPVDSQMAMWKFGEEGEEHGPDNRPEFHPDHPWVVDVLSRKPALHPTIMMRLCTRECYAGLSVMPHRNFNNTAISQWSLTEVDWSI